MKRTILVLLVLVACTQTSQVAQKTLPPIPAGNGTLVGRVQAKDGSVLPGVTVTVTNGTQQRTLVTDAFGLYRFIALPAATYSVKAELAGFGTATRGRVVVHDGGTADVTLTLNPSVSESITVTAEAPMLDVRQAGSATVISSAELSGASGTRTSPRAKSAPAPVPATIGFASFTETPDFYAPFAENDYKSTKDAAVTTFSIDVDKASYANIRRFLSSNRVPPPNAVRIEEMVNYFTYHYGQPSDGKPFVVLGEVAGCPWQPSHRLMRIGIQAKNVEEWKQAPNNLVFLLDVSGSMAPPDRLPLIQQSLRMLVDQLRATDSVAIVVYAGAAGLVLPRTSGADKQAILQAIDRLQAGGSTAGGQGIELAYKIARENFQQNANNRVILATDGDFNVGVSSFQDVQKLIEQERTRGIYLTCIGVGTGNLQDSTIEMLADKGNGNYYYLDSMKEAEKVFKHQLSGTLISVADDVKVQLEFNPATVASYRQIGYENRAMANKDFTDDAKDAGELGAGDSVTVLYEIEPRATTGQIATLKIRYKDPGAATSQEVATAINDEGKSAYEASPDTQFAAAVAEFGMLLRNSKFKGNASWADVSALVRAMRGEDVEGYREEFQRMVESGRTMTGDRRMAMR